MNDQSAYEENEQGQENEIINDTTAGSGSNTGSHQNTIRFLLNRMGSIIKTLTKSRKTSSKGKPSDTRLVFKVINQFDPELQQLISSYLLKVRKRAWIEETCNINFKLEGYRRDLDCSLASIYEQRKGRPCKQSREQPDDITLRKKIRQSDVEFHSPAIIEEKLQPPTG